RRYWPGRVSGRPRQLNVFQVVMTWADSAGPKVRLRAAARAKEVGGAGRRVVENVGTHILFGTRRKAPPAEEVSVDHLNTALTVRWRLREKGREEATLCGGTGQFEPAAVSLSDPCGNRQAEPCTAAVGIGTGGIDAKKAFEDARLQIFGNAFA